jgi:adenosylcobinamide-GDP ribazoletransferase
MKMIRYEVRVFFTALMFFTRIPCPPWVDHSAEYLNKASRYFSLVGIIVGVIAAGVHAFAVQLLPIPVAVLLSLVASVLVTGAFHEDGFADVCDGFGGGWDKERILAIMKDSRVGAFGVLGLVLLLLTRFAVLCELAACMPLSRFMIAVVATHAISRATSASIIFTHAYVQEDAVSKSKPLAQRMRSGELLLLLGIGIAPLIALKELRAFIVLLPLLITRWCMARWCVKWIGGYTGDVLGAVQQVSDVVCLITILALWNCT